MARPDLEVCTSTPEWRQRARDAFRARGRGAKALCARELGVDDSQVNHVLSGRVRTSSWVTAVADWLGIERPQMHVPSAKLQSIVTASRELDDDALQLVLDLVRRLARTRPPDVVDAVDDDE